MPIDPLYLIQSILRYSYFSGPVFILAPLATETNDKSFSRCDHIATQRDGQRERKEDRGGGAHLPKPHMRLSRVVWWWQQEIHVH